MSDNDADNTPAASEGPLKRDVSPSFTSSIAAPPEPTPIAKTGGFSARLMILIVFVALLSGTAGGSLVKLIDDRDSSTISTSSNSPAPQIVSTNDIKSVLKEVEPSVVSINTNSVGVGRLGSGTGMIITADGEVLTNAHVVAGGNSFTVALFDSPKQLPADLVGINRASDVALLKIRNSDNQKFPAATLGDSDSTEVGDPVVAIGNALALSGSPSVTTGIISAKDRSIDTTTEKLENLLQTDAAINYGNSGGPLVNFKAEVIGVNTATADPSISSNIGFAISINTVKPLLSELRQGKNNTNQALLGVTSYTVDAALKQRFPDIGADSGAIIDDVSPNSPASAADIQRLDIIVGFDGQAIKTSEDLVAAVRKRKPGDKVKIEWIRGTDRMTATVELVARPAGQ